jgi:glycine/D-amino acid oxidase-like deaminating enzyme
MLAFTRDRFDAAIVGAGSFGAWTAHHLRRAGLRVALVDAHGPAHARASSGGESRLIRAGYGGHELYARWSLASLREWKALQRRTGQALFHPTGVLWLGRAVDPYARATLRTLRALKVPHEELERAALRRRFPQCRFDGAAYAVLETGAGVLMARRAVQALVEDDVRAGLAYATAAALPPETPRRGRRLTALALGDGSRLRAERFVFACGPWLPRLFPTLLRGRIAVTRQAVFFFGTPAGDARFRAPHLPAWIDFPAGLYGAPDVEARGVKIAFDAHGPDYDPDAGSRLPDPREIALARRALGERFPDLRGAPLIETRVCQYESTSNGEFLIDRHPAFDNVWLVGGGSGHGFKHGPAVGRYAAGLLQRESDPDPRFRLETKPEQPARSVF